MSRILNGTAAVSALKQQAVDAAIARLGFRPNPVDRAQAGRGPLHPFVRQRPLASGRGTQGRRGAALAPLRRRDRSDRAHEDALEREAGYREAVEKAGIADDPRLVVKGDFTESGGLQALNLLPDNGVPFTAIFAANDPSAIGAAPGLFRRQVRVPDDVSLIGFGDVVPAKFSIPPLTTVRPSVYEIGSQSAVLALVNGATPEATLPRPQLVPRESTRRILR